MKILCKNAPAYFNKRKISGFILSLAASSTFGLVPCFALPLLHAGISVSTIITYRFGVAALLLGIIILSLKGNFNVRINDLFKLIALGLCYFLTVVCYIHSFNYISGGVSATIQFIYPIMVILIMITFFHEKFHLYIGISALLAIIGVAILSWEPGQGVGNHQLPQKYAIIIGIGLCLLTGIFNALYYVGIQVLKISHINGLIVTFYVMLIGTIACFIVNGFSGHFEFIISFRELAYAFLLAFVTAVISNISLIMGIDRIGSTISSLLGVMEPVTAICIGVIFFNETLTVNIIGGVLLIDISVIILIGYPAAMRYLDCK